MTIRQDMIEAASRARELLADSAEAVGRFVRSRQNADGGFAGRNPESDLYYTVFAIESLAAIGEDAPVERVAAYLGHFGDGQSLDLIHLASLARCHRAIARAGDADIDRTLVDAMVGHVREYRSDDGAFSVTGDADVGDIYGCFMATGAYEDLGVSMTETDAILAQVRALRRDDGGYANDAGAPVGSSPVTAAAVVLLHALAGEIDEEATRWLLARRSDEGGFAPGPGLEALGMTDLLSTATAIHALATVGVKLDDLREATLDYLDSLWRPVGGFCGSDADGIVDCEYTFYGLLALGHLA